MLPAVAAALLVPVFTALPAAPATEEGARFDNLLKVRTGGGVVVSESAQASQAGLDVLAGGGNAVDAAIAMTFAIGVTRPDNCGIGGGGFLVYRGDDGSTKALDFRESAPAAMSPTSFNQAAEGGTTEDERQGIHREGSGHMIVGVPGVVAGMDEALDVLGSGKYTLADLIAPAERLAREGIRVTWGLQLAFFLHEPRLHNYPETARIYGGGTAHGPFVYRPAGQEDPTVFKQEEYADSLRLIMKYGRDAFYQDARFPDPITGIPRDSIARLIVDDMEGAESSAKINSVLLAKTEGTPNDIGLIDEEDLASYEATWETPLIAHYRDHQVIAMPPPAGGMVAIEILNLLESFKLSSYEHSSADHLHVLAEAQKLAWADRLAYLADPDFESVPTGVLTSEKYAKRRASEIDMGRAKSIEEYGGGTSIDTTQEGRHTTHLSVIDGDGNAVAVTCSLNDQFGSSVVAPGTGFLLNNQLGDFTWTWTDGEPAPANAPAGGKEPRSAQTPAIVVKGGSPVLVTGGAGAPTIILGVVQNILNLVDFNLDVFHAIDAPRIDAANAYWYWFASDQSQPECTSDQLALEHNRIADSVEHELLDRGHRLCLVDSSDGYAAIPLVQSAGTDLSTGERLAVSDPRAFLPPDFYDDQGPMGQ
jgi:gamma-glutamyltranspeptidase/glutathione hydrolase